MSLTLPMPERVDRLERHLREETLIRGQWRVQKSGREYVCALVALAPEVCVSGTTGDALASLCPAEVMPTWLAAITPMLFDWGAERDVPVLAWRYARVARQWHVLSARAWERLEWTVRATLLRSMAPFFHDKELQGSLLKLATEIVERRSRGEGFADQWDAFKRATLPFESPWTKCCYTGLREVMLSVHEGSDILTTVFSSALFFTDAKKPGAKEAHADQLTSAILGDIEQACAAEGK